MHNILMLSTVHNPKDHRIYYKETLSLIKHGYKVNVLAPETTSIKKHIYNCIITFLKCINKNPDIIHCHEPSSLLIASVLKPIKKYKLIYDVHENYPKLVGDRLNIRILKSTLYNLEYYTEMILSKYFVDSIITVDDNIKSKFVKLNKPVSIIPNYPSVNEFYNTDYTNKIVYVGTLSEERGIYEIIKAFKHVHDSELIIVGRFINQGYEKKCIESAKGFKIRFAGNVPYHEVPKYISNKCVCLCVLEDNDRHRQCIPSKFYEYMLSKKPIITTDIWNDLISEAQNGCCVKYGHILQLSECIQYYVDNPDAAKIHGENGYDYAIKNNMTWESCEKTLIGLYKKVVS